MDFEKDFLPKKFNFIDLLSSLLNIFLYAYMILFILFCIIFSGAIVTGTSMQPTLHSSGDIVYYNKYASFTYSDIVVVHKQSSSNYDIIKRVIALSGDKVNYILDSENGTYYVYINGEKLDENYTLPLTTLTLDETYYGDPLYNLRQWESDNFESINSITNRGEGAYIVPSNSVFVMGDNRPSSNDSRISGAYDLSQVYGVVEYIIPKGTNKYIYFAKKIIGIE